MILEVEALAGGGFVTARIDPDRGSILELYDGDGSLLREVGRGGNPIAARDGSFAAGGLHDIQWYAPDGDPIGDPIAILPVDAIPPTYSVSTGGIVAAGDGVVQATWAQFTVGPKGGSPANVSAHFASVDRDGDAIVGPSRLGGFDDRSFPTPLLYQTGNGGTASVCQSPLPFGPRYGAVLRDGEGHALGPLDPIEGTEDFTSGAIIDGTPLADGSLALLVSPTGNSQSDGREPMRVLRLDEDGDVIGEPAAIYNSPFPRDMGEIFANQDGGYTRLWQIWGVGLKYEVYDADGNTLTGQQVAVPFSAGNEDFTYAADMLADGRLAILVEDRNGETPIVSTHFVDYVPSHDAQWGGNVVVISTWQQQELLTRADDTGTLVSSDGVAMKPWIANFDADGAGDVNANGNALANLMVGNAGANVFIAFAGNDKLYGFAGDDWLLGQDGNDLIDGGDGADVAVGGAGNDSIASGTGADTVAGDAGDDNVEAGDGADTAHGGAGDDLVSGNDGNDSLTGGAGEDWLSGGDGADTVRGDRDDDTLQGGDGPDRFVFAHAAGNDTIIDFDWSGGDAGSDRLVIERDEDGTLNGVVIDDVGDLFDAATDSADGVLIALGAGHSVLLVGVEKADLSADLFLLAA